MHSKTEDAPRVELRSRIVAFPLPFPPRSAPNHVLNPMALPPSPQDAVPLPALEHRFERYSPAGQTRSEAEPVVALRLGGCGGRCEHGDAWPGRVPRSSRRTAPQLCHVGEPHAQPSRLPE